MLLADARAREAHAKAVLFHVEHHHIGQKGDRNLGRIELRGEMPLLFGQPGPHIVYALKIGIGGQIGERQFLMRRGLKTRQTVFLRIHGRFSGW